MLQITHFYATNFGNLNPSHKDLDLFKIVFKMR
jgi:hypothetical protein